MKKHNTKIQNNNQSKNGGQYFVEKIIHLITTFGLKTNKTYQ
jgi:hypothetical protein